MSEERTFRNLTSARCYDETNRCILSGPDTNEVSVDHVEELYTEDIRGNHSLGSNVTSAYSNFRGDMTCDFEAGVLDCYED